jgi:Tol biopolymer transport system component
VSVSSGGGQADRVSVGPSISADGRYVAFLSRATNLVAGSVDNGSNAFVHDLRSGATRRINAASLSRLGNRESDVVSISGNGRYVAFASYSADLQTGDVFVYDMRTGATRRASRSDAGRPGNRRSFAPSISADGRLVAFSSYASNLVGRDRNGQPDVFVRDLRAGTTRLVSRNSAGIQGNGPSERTHHTAMSPDGRHVAFTSWASNLVPADTNGHADVFVRDLRTGSTQRVSVGSHGEQGNSMSDGSAMSAVGTVIFGSAASNLVGGDTNDRGDVFLRPVNSRSGQPNRG